MRNRYGSVLKAGGALVTAAALVVPITAASPAFAATAPAGAYADAYGIGVDVTVLGALSVPSTPLGQGILIPPLPSEATQTCPPQQAKPDTTSLLDVDASPAAKVGTIDSIAGANCSPASAVASAQTAAVDVLPGAVPLVTADLVRAQANSDCKVAPNGQGSFFANLVVNGTKIVDPSTVAPNTVIEVPGVAKVIINEQHPAATGRGIVVNGLHIIGESVVLRGDIIISHAASGVVCPGGPGSALGGLPAPDISFDKDATPSTAKAGDTVTYTATVKNTSANACDVMRLVDHLSPGFTPVSTAGAFGKTFDTPPPVRDDKGLDVVVRPSGVTLAPKASMVQTFVVKLNAGIAPGTYYNNLEILCNANGDFVSGPLAPVTVPAPAAAVTAAAKAPAVAAKQLPRTGNSPLIALGAMVVVGASFGLRRLARR